MTEDELAELITSAAVLDDRLAFTGDEVTDDMTTAMWFEAIGHLDFVDARRAVIGHYQESEYRLKPVDVIRRVKAARARRMAPAVLAAPPMPPAEVETRQDEKAYRDSIKAQLAAFAGGNGTAGFLGNPKRDRPVVDMTARRALRGPQTAADGSGGAGEGPVTGEAPKVRSPAVEAAYASAHRLLSASLAQAQPYMEQAAAEYAGRGQDPDVYDLTIRAAELMRQHPEPPAQPPADPPVAESA